MTAKLEFHPGCANCREEARRAMTRDEFMARMAKDCRNCLECSSRPCDACCAGGVCDRECRCDDIRDAEYDRMIDPQDDDE